MIKNIIPFMIYSYLGASLEHISYYISKENKKLLNPIITGFPLYGIGAYCVILINNILQKYNLNSLTRFLIYAILLTLIEYIVGKYVGAGKKNENGDIDAWDYTDQRFNYRGIISLKHFIAWGILGLCVEYIHPKIIKSLDCLIL